MYLVDTNIFLEALLEQNKAQEVRSLFQKIDLEEMFITDLSLHSMGIILFGLGKFELFSSFLDDMIVDGIEILSLQSVELKSLHGIAQSDFDDAYQYSVAEKYNLQLISFDQDFDRSKRKKKEPSEILRNL